MPGRPLCNYYVGQSNGATAVNLDTEQLLPAEWWQINSASVQNSTGESISGRFYAVKGDLAIQIAPTTAAITTTAAANILPVLILAEGWKLRVSVTGTSLSGPFYLLVTGWRGVYPVAGEPIPALAAAQAQEY